MNTLLDTDVISKATKSPANQQVLDWLARQEHETVFFSVITLAELRDGVDRMPHGKKRDLIESWLKHVLPERFQDRVLDVDAAIADRAGSMMAKARRDGHNAKWMDLLIASTAFTNGMQLATLNRKDFQPLDVMLVDFEQRF